MFVLISHYLSSIHSGQIVFVHSEKCIAYTAQGWHFSCFVFWRTGPRKRKTPSPNTPVMRGLQQDREPEGKAWGMTSADDRLARMSVHTQQHKMHKFLQYNVQVKCQVQIQQLKLRYWQLL